MSVTAQGPYRVEWRGDVLFLTLDTPGSSVNIFDGGAARQVIETMRSLPPTARAVVFGSAKRDSYLNGARLMALSAIHRADDLTQLGQGVVEAYRAVRESRVPTIAAVAGNCFGCGVEFVLHCHFRIAVDTYDTQFYLTEIADYLMLPAFGAMRLLPERVGLDHAIDLLLWGARWRADEAVTAGLVDAVARTPQAMARLIAEVAAGTLQRRAVSHRGWSRRHDRAVARARQRIQSLPPPYHSVYEACLRQMEQAVRQPSPTAAQRRAEARRIGHYAAAPMVKETIANFFIRQTAHAIQSADAASEAPFVLSFANPDERLAAWAEMLAARRLRDARVSTDGPTVGRRKDGIAVTLTPHAHGVAPQINVLTSVQAVSLAPDGPATLILANEEFFELACGRVPEPPATALYRFLVRAGLHGVVSRGAPEPAVNRWLCAYFAPLVGFCADGHAACDVHESLRRAGCVLRPHDILRWASSGAIADLLAAAHVTLRAASRPALRSLKSSTFEGGRFDQRVVDAWCVALLAEALRQLQARHLPHPSCADAVTSTLLGFPRHLGSLCRHLTPARARDLLRRAARSRRWVAENDLMAIERYAAGGRGFYLG